MLRANRECMQLTSCIVMIADYVFAYVLLVYYTCMAIVKEVMRIVVEAL